MPKVNRALANLSTWGQPASQNIVKRQLRERDSATGRVTPPVEQPVAHEAPVARFARIKNAVSGAASQTFTAIKSVPAGIASVAKRTGNAALSGIKSAGNAARPSSIKNGAIRAFTAIKSVPAGIASVAKRTGNAALSGIKNVGNAFSGALESVKDFGSNYLTKEGRMARFIIKHSTGPVQEALSGFKSFRRLDQENILYKAVSSAMNQGGQFTSGVKGYLTRMVNEAARLSGLQATDAHTAPVEEEEARVETPVVNIVADETPVAQEETTEPTLRRSKRSVSPPLRYGFETATTLTGRVSA
ncbi:MAG: hypothetical protein S4CHLAM37_08160 [Chlamydiia bacterium]|nr:hypothetical protein [Chlamydiia bacterium]